MLLNTSIKILIVDSHEQTLRIMRNLCSELGYDNVDLVLIGASNDISEVKMRLQSDTYHLVIASQNARALDIFKMCKSDPRFYFIPFIMVVSDADKAEAMELHNYMGPRQKATYIIKPFDAKMLRQKIMSLFEQGPQ